MEISKQRKIIGWILSAIPCAAITMSGMVKLSGSPQMIENMSKIKMGEITPYIAVLEITCVILYLIPKTSNIGFFLLCSYVGGIIVGEIGMGNPPILGIGVAVLLYVGTMLRKPKLSGLEI